MGFDRYHKQQVLKYNVDKASFKISNKVFKYLLSSVGSTDVQFHDNFGILDRLE